MNAGIELNESLTEGTKVKQIRHSLQSRYKLAHS